MYRDISTCIYALVIFNCTQAIDPFFNNLKNATRGVVSELTNTTIVQKGSKLAGEAIVDSTTPLTSFAVAIARVFGNDREITTFTKDNNIVDLVYTERFKARLDNEDARLNIEELVTKYGYPVQRHQVITQDGYVLTMFRIPNKGSPVFLMHGLTGSADDFIVAGPVSGLAYLLADEGFDVWMGNARGNKFSRQHTSLKPSEAKFWDFSWHEIGYYDLPAMIDYTLDVTGQKSVKYLGHSQGTTTFFVMASERTEYNNKIDVMIALSPVAYVSNMKSPIAKIFAAGTNVLQVLAKSTGIYEFFADTTLDNILKALLCGAGPISNIFCRIPLLLFIGASVARVNVTNLPVLIGHTPSGASYKQFAHYGQEILSRKFRQFDYGFAINLGRYGSQEPPDYNLENVVAPIVLFYGADDWLSQPRDVEMLATRLPNVVQKYNIPMFNHLDFLLAIDFKTLIFPKILQWFSQ